MELLALIVGIMGNAASLMVFVSPVPTFWRICRKRTTEEFSVVPYVTSLFSQILWVYYGVLDPNGILILTISAVGAALEMLFVAVYMIFASRPQLLFTLRLLSLGSLTFTILLMGTLLGSRGNQRFYIVGVLSGINGVCMFAAPLSVTRLVMRTKSVEYMPLFLSVCTFSCGGTWFVYAVILRDLFVLVPAGIGFLLGTLQLILYSIYYKRTPKLGKSAELEREATESSFKLHDLEKNHPADPGVWAAGHEERQEMKHDNN